MSRFDGWLVRFIMMRGTSAALSVKAAAKGACIRADTFMQALCDPKLVRADARHLGIDPDEMRAIHAWIYAGRAEADIAESMVKSAAAVTRPKPDSEKYKGSATRLGAWQPHKSNTDHLNMPINPVEHPEPQGEWHEGLNAAGEAYPK